MFQEGPSPHNCNLAVKGILGLGAYAILLNATGQTQRATVYINQAQDYGTNKVRSVHDIHFSFFFISKLLDESGS